MTWNHRVMQTGELFGIHEVYHDENGLIWGATENPVPAIGDDLNGLKEELSRMLEACEKPIVYTVPEKGAVGPL